MTISSAASKHPRRARRRHRTRSWWASVSILAIVIGFFSIVVATSLRTTADLASQNKNPFVKTAYAQEQCLTRLMQAKLPKGARVYVVPNSNGYDAQLLTQYMTLWAVPTSFPHDAKWTVTLVPRPGGCYGETLRIRHF